MMGDIVDSPDVNALLVDRGVQFVSLGFISFVLLVDLCLSWAAIINGFLLVIASVHESEDFDYGGQYADIEAGSLLVLTAIRSAFVLLVYGIPASQIPASKPVSQNGEQRKPRSLVGQGGHSLMLTYFVGMGPIAEYFRALYSAESTVKNANDRVKAAALFQSKWLCLPDFVLHGLTMQITGMNTTSILLAIFSSGVCALLRFGLSDAGSKSKKQ